MPGARTLLVAFVLLLFALLQAPPTSGEPSTTRVHVSGAIVGSDMSNFPSVTMGPECSLIRVSASAGHVECAGTFCTQWNVAAHARVDGLLWPIERASVSVSSGCPDASLSCTATAPSLAGVPSQDGACSGTRVLAGSRPFVCDWSVSAKLQQQDSATYDVVCDAALH